jgi:hypothetical protein
MPHGRVAVSHADPTLRVLMPNMGCEPVSPYARVFATERTERHLCQHPRRTERPRVVFQRRVVQAISFCIRQRIDLPGAWRLRLLGALIRIQQFTASMALLVNLAGFPFRRPSTQRYRTRRDTRDR